MASISKLTPTMLAQFTQIDYSREMALIAITVENGVETQQGVARYSINADETSCEFAIVVSDQLQGQGIGTRLMKALMEAARSHDLTVMQGTVLAKNSSMLRLMEDLGFSITRVSDDSSVFAVQHWL